MLHSALRLFRLSREAALSGEETRREVTVKLFSSCSEPTDGAHTALIAEQS